MIVPVPGIESGYDTVTGRGSPIADGLVANCVPSTNRATFVRQSVPSSMVAGQSYPVSITMANVGISTWTTANSYALGSWNPPNNQTWGTGRIQLPTAVAPGSQVTFAFTVTAPTRPGSYDFQWHMVQDMVEWFGDSTPNVPVAVNPAGAAPFVINAPGQVYVDTNLSVTVTAADTYGNTGTGYTSRWQRSAKVDGRLTERLGRAYPGPHQDEPRLLEEEVEWRLRESLLWRS
jgi:hypothetical protein